MLGEIQPWQAIDSSSSNHCCLTKVLTLYSIYIINAD